MSDQSYIDKARDVREGEELPLKRLEAYLQRELPQTEGELAVAQFPSGYSNLTYLLNMGGRDLVLRRPPFGAQVKSGHDMGREYRILSALDGYYPKVPHPILFCEDESIIGAPFYIMERVKGVILRSKMSESMYPHADTMAGIANSLVDTFVELHAVDYERAGLGDLGRPEGYVRRQVEGWSKRYLKAKTDDIPALEQMARWLAEHQPAESGASLIHNDFKYDNLVLDSDDWTKVIAVLDWEMSTIGDPLMDLGSSLGYWVNDSDPDWMTLLALSPTTLPGNPVRGDIAQRYAERSGRDLGPIVFYYVYGLFKLCVVLQQIYFRYKKGYTKDPRFAPLIQAIQGLSLMGMQAVEKNRIDDLM